MSLVDLIQATFSSNNQTRAQAELQILQARDQNRGLFLLACSQEFAINDNSEQVRVCAAMLVKYTLVNSPDGIEAMWLSVEHDIREKIKTNILATLAFPKDLIRNPAAQLIALIYPIEHRQNRWKDLISVLSKNMNNEDPEIRKSSITVLNHLCNSPNFDETTLSSETLEQFFVAVFSGLQEKESIDVQIIALSTLESSLGLMKEMFRDQAIRQMVEQSILQALTSDDARLKQKALECVVKFVEKHYNYLREWINEIWKVTEKLIVNSTETELVIPAIEIWTSIAIEEGKIKNSNSLESDESSEEESLNLISHIASTIIPILMKNLLDAEKYQDMDYEEEEYRDAEISTINSCSQKCLERIAVIVGVTPFLGFVDKYVNSENDVERRAALIAYSCMLCGPNDESISLTFLAQSAFSILVRLLKESKKLCIRAAAAEALGKTAEVAPNVFLNKETEFASLSAELTKCLESPPIVSQHIAKAWRCVGEQIAVQSEDESKPNIKFDPVIQALIKNAFREDLEDRYYPLIQDSLLAVKFLIESIDEGDDIAKNLHLLLERLQLSKKIEDDERRKCLQLGLSSCLQAVLSKHHFEGLDSTAKELFQLGVDIIEMDNKVAGFRIIGALVSSLGSESEAFFDKVWSYVEPALELYKQQDIFDSASECVSDLARACPEKMKSHLEKVLGTYLNTINGDSCCNEAGISVIAGISGIIIGCREQIVPYVNIFWQIYKFLIGKASKLPDKKDSESLESLREKVLESYSEFFRVITQSSNPEAIFDSLPQVIEYLVSTSKREFDPTLDYMRTTFSFIVDIVSRFGDKAKGYISPDFIISLMDTLEEFKHFKDSKEIQDTLTHAIQVFKTANFEIF